MKQKITHEQMVEFYDFLTGSSLPEGMEVPKGLRPKINEKKAETVIWFLQEHLRVLPDHYEICGYCGILYDSHSEGLHVDVAFKRIYNFCGNCEFMVPEGWEDKTPKR